MAGIEASTVIEDHPWPGREGNPVSFRGPILGAVMAQADMTYRPRFGPAPAGSLMRWSGQARAKGASRLLDPNITWRDDGRSSEYGQS